MRPVDGAGIGRTVRRARLWLRIAGAALVLAAVDALLFFDAAAAATALALAGLDLLVVSTLSDNLVLRVAGIVVPSARRARRRLFQTPARAGAATR